ncbi:MAG: DUF1778 domain-containing protein [Elusimicrobia bacterium]|nr:DUF1778 domain-containing protein [Elusimicrobiota bacterium]
MSTLRKSQRRHPKSERLEARVSSQVKKLFEEAASLQGITLTDFVIASVEDAAKRTLQEQEIMRLSTRDRAVFVEALLHPPEPSQRLRTAVERYKRAFGT